MSEGGNETVTRQGGESRERRTFINTKEAEFRVEEKEPPRKSNVMHHSERSPDICGPGTWLATVPKQTVLAKLQD